jgi:type II secretion system protein C
LLRKGRKSARLYLENATTTGMFGDSTMLLVGGVNEAPSPAKITSREILTDYIRPSPVYDGDTIVGYEVYSGAKTGPFAQMGLQAGDLIIELNGTPLNDPQVAWDMFHQLADGVVLSGTVTRKGAAQAVSLDGSLIVRAEEARLQPVTQAMLSPPAP